MPRGCGRSGVHFAPQMLKMSPWLVAHPSFGAKLMSTWTSMPRVYGWPTAGSGSPHTNIPLLAIRSFSTCIQSKSSSKFS